MTFKVKKSIRALFWAITQRVVVIPYRRFGTAYRSHPQVRNCRYSCVIALKNAVLSYFVAKAWNHVYQYVSSDFHCVVNIFALLGCYAARVDSYLPTFRDNLQFPPSKIGQSCFKMGPVTCPETSVNNCQFTPRDIPENDIPEKWRSQLSAHHNDNQVGVGRTPGAQCLGNTVHAEQWWRNELTIVTDP